MAFQKEQAQQHKGEKEKQNAAVFGPGVPQLAFAGQERSFQQKDHGDKAGGRGECMRKERKAEEKGEGDWRPDRPHAAADAAQDEPFKSVKRAKNARRDQHPGKLPEEKPKETGHVFAPFIKDI